MKKYLDMNVYDAAVERIAWLFDNFDNVLVSFSGGKDSGVCLEMCHDYAKEHGMLDKMAYYHLDYEAQYQMTTDYVTDVFERINDVRRWWLCLPVNAQCACRMDGAYWVPWESSKRDIWARDMPTMECVINETNAPFDVSNIKTDKETQDEFTNWFTSEYGTVADVVGIRTQESYDRLSIIVNTDRRLRFKKKKWTITKAIGSSEHGRIVHCYPIYDWQVEDVWTYYARTGHAYSRLYDLYHLAGLKPSQMRVASPFNDCGIHSLKLYKAIDPNTWGKMVGRVNGVSFAGLYGGTTAMGWRNITLPEGHTWKSYCHFLLQTLDPKLREHYERIFTTSLEYWTEKGGFVADDVMPELEDVAYDDMGASTRYKGQRVVRFDEYPDDMDTQHFASLPSYKRMCVCILKNDYNCKYMGFGQTKEAYRRRKAVMEKYASLL